MVSLTIAIPAYNEEEIIAQVVKQAKRAAKKQTNSYEILIVNDGSTDNTGRIVNKLAKEDSRIRVIHHKLNQGFSGAIGDCYRSGQKDLVFFAPADGQFDFGQLPRFFKAIKQADVVLSNRDLSLVSLHRRINTFFFRLIYRLLFNLPFQDVSSCILWKKKVLDNINITSHKKSAAISVETVYQAKKGGFKIAEVPISWQPRRAGKEKGGNPFIALLTLVDMIRLWWKVKLKVQN